MKDSQRKFLLNLRNIQIPELLDVIYGEKPCLMYGMKESDALNLKRQFPDLSVIDGGADLDPRNKRTGNSLFIITRQPTICQELFAAQAKENHREIGHLLGYPGCCIDYYLENFLKKNSGDYIYYMYKNTKKPNFLLNMIFNFSSRLKEGSQNFDNLQSYYNKNLFLWPTILHLHYIPHVPCSFDCACSIAQGERNFTLMEKYFFSSNSLIKGVLNNPLLFINTFEWAIFKGSLEDNLLYYSKLKPLTSLMSPPLLNAIKRGNKIEVKADVIIVYNNEQPIFTYPKKHPANGFIINFS